MARYLHRFGSFTAHHKWVVLGAWLLALIVVVGLVKTVGANTSNNLELPGTDSQDATDLLAKRFPPQQNGKNPIVFHTATGKVTDADDKQAITESFDAIKKLPHVYSATSPFSQQGQAQISDDKQTAFLTVLLDIGNEDVTEGLAQSFLDAAEPARRAGMKVAASGQIGAELSEPETKSSDAIGLIAAMIILTLTFGTLVAMGMAIIPAVLGLLVGLSIIGLLGHVTEVPSIAPTLATMIGLGVGIDYALFMVSRYRVHRAEGMATGDAIAQSVGTTGTAIVFAGGTVVIALVTLLVAGIPLVTSLGYASAFAVLTAVLAAISLLPALLALIGDGIDRLALPAFLHPRQKPPDKGFWAAWAAFVTGHPGRAIGITLLLLFTLMIPFFSLELGQEDIGATPKDTTERQAYDLIAAGFGPGYTGPLLVAVNLGDTAAAPSDEFEQQYSKAQNLQAELEQEQATGETGAASLQRSADELEAQQQLLLAEKATLETKAGDLKQQKGQLTKSTAALDKQRTILAQLEPLIDQGVKLIEQGARLASQAKALVAKIEKVKAAEEKATDPVVE
ncbi:MAG: MMPL family transporter, partial [Solirubrobacterales bacterium]